MVEYVDSFVDIDCGAHFSEHVGLRYALGFLVREECGSSMKRDGETS